MVSFSDATYRLHKNKSYYDIHSVFILLECALSNNFNNKPPDKRDVENLDFELIRDSKALSLELI